MTDSERQIEFMKLYHEVHPSLTRFARAMNKNREDARDLVSETILIAYENFHKVNSRQAFLSYLFTIASRLHKRRRWRLRFFGEYDEDKATQIISDVSAPDLGVDVELLYTAIDKLPTKMKESLVLFEISGLSLEEIREIQGGTLSGVKSRIARGREKLKEILVTEPVSLDYKLETENSSGIHKKNVEIRASEKIIEIGAL
jgi:RNA polymerase sigma-70 factor (ECF subfamily)